MPVTGDQVTRAWLTCLLVQEAARLSTACTAMYRPGTLKLSNMISAVYSPVGQVVRCLGDQVTR